MAVVYRIGRIPIKYHANICSYATFITVLLYISGIVIPYIISGLTLNFFPKYDIRSERPEVILNPDMEFTLTDTNNAVNLRFKMDQNFDALSEATRIPVVQFPQVSDKKFLKFAVYFPLSPAEVINNVQFSFSFTTQFTEAKQTFKSYVQIDESSFDPASAVNIFGSLTFNQELPINTPTDKNVPLSEEYLAYIRTNPVATNSSDPSKRGQPDFYQRNVYWTYGPTSLFEIHFSMRIPMLKIIRQQVGFYRFLDGWTTYISIAVPCFILIWRALERFFGSGIIPIRQEVEVTMNTESIPKFNR